MSVATTQNPHLSDAQITYLSEVLGVSSLIIPESPHSTALDESAPPPPPPPPAEGQLTDRIAGHLAEDLADQLADQLADPASEDAMGRLRLRGDLASSRMICLFHESNRWPLVGEHAEMATKMIFAMKLDSADVLTIEWRGSGPNQELKSLLLSAGSRPVLLFGIAEAHALFETPVKVGEFIDFDGVHVMPTYSLSELQDQPGLKKATWSHMQHLMKTLI